MPILSSFPAGKNANTFYGTCSTAAGTVAKVVDNVAGFVLKTGVSIRVRFSSQNTASSPTLNINGTGAKAIKKYGTTAVETYRWYSGGIVDFTYDGTYWIMQDGGLASTSYYGVTKLSTSTTSTATNVAATPSAVKAAMDKAKAAQEKPTAAVVTLAAANWTTEGTYSLESTYPNATYNLNMSLSSTCTKKQYDAFSNAIIIGDDNSNIIKALGTIPTIDIPVKLEVVKK